MRRVGIIGLGNVGATAAFNLFTHGYCDEIVLLDVNEAKMQAEAIDLLDTCQSMTMKLKFIMVTGIN